MTKSIFGEEDTIEATQATLPWQLFLLIMNGFFFWDLFLYFDLVAIHKEDLIFNDAG